jgi:short-subunit dehydrogenase
MTRTALVTGASSGIGQAIAEALHARGFTTFGTSRRTSGVTPFPMLPLDVTSDDSVEACVRELLKRSGQIDVLVNNAGYALIGAIEETGLAEARAQLEANFFGVARMVRAVAPHMREAGRGHILNIGSLAGLTSLPFNAYYSASKFALEAYSEALWHELQPFGIAVSLLEPGFVRTPISHAAHLAAAPLAAYDGPRGRVNAALSRAVEHGIPAADVARVVLAAIESRSPRLRYRIGSDARWLPRLRQALPWSMFARGVRRRLAVDAPA